MKSKIILLLLVLLSVSVSAETFVSDGICYKINNGQTVSVIAKNDGKYAGDVSIPSTVSYNGTTYQIDAIERLAFDNCSGLTSITIPNSVASIGWHAFYNCRDLTSVTVLETESLISKRNLAEKKIVLNGEEANLTELFVFLTGMIEAQGVNDQETVSYYLNQTIGQIGLSQEDLLAAKEFLSDYKEADLTRIGNEAFMYCQNLESVILPESVAYICENAFSDCNKLVSVKLGESLLDIGKRAFANCWALSNVIMPESLVSIGEEAFTECWALTNLTIPKSVTSIGNESFKQCSHLENVTISNPEIDSESINHAFVGTPYLINQISAKQKASKQQVIMAGKQHAIEELPALKRKIGESTFNNLNAGIITEGMKWSSIMAFRDYINKYKPISGNQVFDELPDDVNIGGVPVKETYSNAYGTGYAIGFDNRKGVTFSGGFIEVDNGTVTVVNMERK
jgi:hypothetical protein